MNDPRRLVFLATVIIYCLYIAFFWNYSIDDAFITFRYAENLADGQGFVFNIGDQPLEGYSNFLWLVILAALYKVGLPTYLCAKIIGLVSFPLAAMLFFGFHLKKNDTLAWLMGPLLLISPITAFWGLSGLELGLHTLLLSLSAILLLRRSPWLYAVLPPLILSRPEGVALALGMILTVGISDLLHKRIEVRRLLIPLIIVIVTYAGLTVFRLTVFGYPLPNTYYAKIHHRLELGFYELGRMLRYFAPLALAMILAIWRMVRQRFRQADLAVYTILFLLQAIISARMDPVMNFLFRYMIMVLPFLIGAGLLVISLIKNTKIKWVAVAAVTVSLLVPLPRTLEFVRATDLMMEAQSQVVEWANTLPSGTTISMSDMGRVPYGTKKIHYYDIYGLVNDDVAHDGFIPAREFARLPDYFILVGYVVNDQLKLSFWREQVLAYGERFNTTYQAQIAFVPEGKTIRDPGYYYIVFRRNDLPGGEPQLPSGG